MEDNVFFEFLRFLGIDPQALFPALMGALISIKRMKKMSIFKSITSVVFGLLCAIYLTPIFMHLLPHDWTLEYSIAFLVGYSGLSTLDLVFYFIKKEIDKTKKRLH